MGIVSYFYKKSLVCRYDKEVGFPYYSYNDFKGFKQDAFTFTNSKGIEIHYFYYYYDNYKDDKLILFCHGLCPGHTAYLAEIECLARRGYKILTLDYTGCGESKGKRLGSLNTPTRDVDELLNYLKIDKPVVIMGHSLGGYTTLNLMNKRKDLQKAVILSGFLSIPLTLPTMIKSKFVVKRILSYERKIEPNKSPLDNIEYLKTTKDRLFMIQSEDDQMIPYNVSLKVVEEMNNPNIKTLKYVGRKHNPNYTDDAINYMNEVFGQYYYLIKQKKLKTDAEKIEYFKDVSLARLTKQDEKLFDEIQEFIEKK